MEETTYIYGLLCPLENKIRYVGRSRKVAQRFYQHVNLPNEVTWKPSTPKDLWIRELANKGLKPKLVILESVATEFKGDDGEVYSNQNACQDAEHRWIDHFRQEGHPLTNSDKYSQKEKPDSQLITEALELGRQMFGDAR